MDLKVELKLQSKNNHGETILDFITDSEKEFGLPERDLENISIGSLELYIEFLDELWNK